ncbi:hypothetical protein Tco_0494073 [Tanacetum coccineum]
MEGVLAGRLGGVGWHSVDGASDLDNCESRDIQDVVYLWDERGWGGGGLVREALDEGQWLLDGGIDSLSEVVLSEKGNGVEHWERRRHV